MYETDIRRLQKLIDRSHARMGAHMRSILPRPDAHGREVVTYLHCIKHAAEIH